MEIGVLGPLRITVGDVAIEIAGERQRRAIVALVLAGPDGATTDELATTIWDDEDRPTDYTAHVRTLISRIRSRLDDVGGPPVANRPSGYRLDPDIVDVDAWRFDGLLDGADSTDDDAMAESKLETALELWRGQPFDDLGDLEGLQAEATRLEERRLDAEERRLDRWLDRGRTGQVASRAASLIVDHPYRERLREAEVLALYRSGRQAEALQRLADHRRQLVDDLGLEPSQELQELERRIIQQDQTLQSSTPAPEQLLRGYRMAEELGRGAFAIVRRGVQPGLERAVAIKIIRAEFANRPEFIRRFETEAHLVARLEHPFMVPLYDYWREPDRACLVFRYLRGGSLESHLTANGSLPIEACRRMVSQIGSALTTAHDAGIVHRDVKPANVLLDDVGNYYLGDFGIALDSLDVDESLVALSGGSPAYASPEQLRKQRVGPPADVHGLAISLFEALTSRLPFADSLDQAELLARQLAEPLPSVLTWRNDLPPAIDEVLRDATAKDPAKRLPSIERFVDAVEDVLGDADPAAPTEANHPISRRVGVGTALPVEAIANPYKGLRAFTEADAVDFHGRERLIDRLIEVLSPADGADGARIVSVVGPSGIGKSSVVRAGLLPALRRGAVAGSEQWFVASMVPGERPFDELGRALRSVAGNNVDASLERLAEDERGIARAAKALLDTQGDQGELLLVIDQFEELFTLPREPSTATRFLAAIEHAVNDPGARLRVVLTLRADFWDRPMRHASFAQLIEPSTIQVAALAPDELQRAITEPASRLGRDFEAGLVSRIVADVADEAGALPLLQYTLTELWERHSDNTLTIAAYDELGGVPGALAARAEHLYEAASDIEKKTLRRMFGRLITPGGGTDDTRRRVLRAELGTEADVGGLLDRFGKARLLSFDHEPESRAPTVDLAHEALIRSWPRLQDWLDEDRQGLQVLRHLSDSAAAWTDGGRDDGDLYRGARLATAEEWSAGNPSALNAGEEAFLTASAESKDETERVRRHQVKRLRRAVVGVGVVAVLAMVAGTAAVLQSRRAAETAFRSDTLVLATAAEANAAAAPDLALQLALAAVERGNTPRTRNALLVALETEPRLESVFGAPDSTHCAHVSAADGPTKSLARAGAVDPDGLRELFTVSLRDGSQSSSRTVPDFSGCPRPDPTGRKVAIVRDNALEIVDLADSVADLRSEISVEAMAWAHDGSEIVTIGRSNVGWEISVHDAQDLSVERVVVVDVHDVSSLSVSSDLARALILQSHGPPVVVDIATRRQRSLELPGGGPVGALSTDGRVAVTFGVGRVIGWDAATGDMAWEASGLRGSDSFGHVDMNPSGSLAAMSTAEGIEFIDLRTGAIAGQPMLVQGLAHFASDTELVVNSPGAPLRLFDLNAVGLSRVVVDGLERGGVIAPDASVAAAIRSEGSVAIDVATGAETTILDTMTTQVRPAENGQVVGWDSDAVDYVLWQDGVEILRTDMSAMTPDGLRNMRAPRVGFGRVLFQQFDPTDASMGSNRLILLEVATGKVVSTIDAPNVLLSELLESDRIFISPFDGPARLVDLTGATLIEFPMFQSGVRSAALARDGHLILGLGDGTVLRWAINEAEVVETLVGPDSEAIRLEPIDRGVIVQHTSGEVTQWQWGSPTRVSRLLEPGTFTGMMTLSTDGSELFVPREQSIIAFPLSVDRWISEACARSNSDVDAAVWEAATGLDPPSASLCS